MMDPKISVTLTLPISMMTFSQSMANFSLTGEQEVLGDQVPEGPSGQDGENIVMHRPSIDHMIEQLQREQDQRLAASGEVPIGSPPPVIGSPRGVSRSNSGKF